jgi:hypothetical protein
MFRFITFPLSLIEPLLFKTYFLRFPSSAAFVYYVFVLPYVCLCDVYVPAVTRYPIDVRSAAVADEWMSLAYFVPMFIYNEVS